MHACMCVEYICMCLYPTSLAGCIHEVHVAAIAFKPHGVDTNLVWMYGYTTSVQQYIEVAINVFM